MNTFGAPFWRGWAVGLVAVLSALGGTGCAGTSVFRSYPQQINPVLQDFRMGRQPAVEASMKRKVESRDGVLYLLERARLHQIAGDLANSIEDYRTALAALAERDGQPLVTARGAAAVGAATVINENVIPYEPAGYERVMAHHYQALNYLLLGNTDAATVEIRLANHEQEKALERHGKELARARDEARRERLDMTQADAEIRRTYAGMDEVAGRVKDSFQNAYSFYLAGLVFELAGLPNDAYVSYRRALEIMPGNTVVQRDVLRLARALGAADHVSELIQRFPHLAGAGAPSRGGDIVILVDDEFVPQKEEVKIPIPLISSSGIHGITAVAFPIYRKGWVDPIPVHAAVAGLTPVRTEPVVLMRAIAVKALQERIPALAVRQVLRSAAKGVMAKKLSDDLGPLAMIGASIANYLTENADLRSWLSLPDNAQIARLSVAPGEHRLDLAHGAVRVTVPVTVTAGGTTVVHVTRAGQMLYARKVEFGAKAERQTP